MLKKIWPTPYKIKKGNLVSFLIQLVIFLVICAVVGWVIGLLSAVPLVGVLAWIAGLAMEIYSIVGVVLCILRVLGIV